MADFCTYTVVFNVSKEIGGISMAPVKQYCNFSIFSKAEKKFHGHRQRILQEIEKIAGSPLKENDKLFFVDDEGDVVVLDDEDSFAEALKFAIQSRDIKFVIRGEMEKLSFSEKMQENKIASELLELMEKMKDEITNDVMTSVNEKMKLKKKKSGEKMQKMVSKENSASLEKGMCTECLQSVREPYFVCLEKNCSPNICQRCQIGHQSSHVMLRLPEKLRSSRRKLAETAGLTLMSKERSSKSKPAKERINVESKCTSVEAASKYELVVTFTVKNTGTDLDDLKLQCLANSNFKIKPLLNEIKLAPLKSGMVATFSVRLDVTNVAPGSHFTSWIITQRGYRIKQLEAKFNIEKETEPEKTEVVIEDKVDKKEILETAEVVVVDEQLNALELFLRSEDLKLKSEASAQNDDSLSQYSCLSSSNSSVHDFEIVAQNASAIEAEDQELSTKDDETDSYVLATPLNTCDETFDDEDLEIINRSNDLTEFFNQLTNSLSTLSSEATTVMRRESVTDDVLLDPAAAEHRFLVDPPINEVSTIDFVDAVGDHSQLMNVVEQSVEDLPEESEMFFAASSEPIVHSIKHEEWFVNSDEEFKRALQVIEAEEAKCVAEEVERRREEEELNRKAAAELAEQQELDELARSVENFRLPSTPDDVAGKANTDEKAFVGSPETKTDTVASVVTTALRVTTQALSSVSNVLQAVASRQTGQAARRPEGLYVAAAAVNEDWQPPRAWVPKSTQTTWAPPQEWTPKRVMTEAPWSTQLEASMKTLKEMGFMDEFKNYNLLMENNGVLEAVLEIYCAEQNNLSLD